MQRGILGGAVLILSLVLISGCELPFFPDVQVPVPVAVQTVLADRAAFEPGADDPLAQVEPGTVMDDLAVLDGCWGTVFTSSDFTINVGFFVVYQFDNTAGTFTRWSGMANAAGELWPLMPLLSVETGSFTVEGPAAIVLTDEHMYTNIDPVTSQVSDTLYEVGALAVPMDRPVIVTLSDDSMLLYIDVETVDDIDPTEQRPIFYKFDCPAGA